jgi:phage tail-like protein
MDSNQTRFHLVLGQSDWARCTTDTGALLFATNNQSQAPFYWNATRSEVTLGVRINVFHSSAGNQPPTLDARRGAAQDRFGNFFWIADSGTEILVTSVGSGVTTHFWSSSDECGQHCANAGGFAAGETEKQIILSFASLTITGEHYLVAGVVDPAGLVIFDLFRGGPPRRLVWPRAIPFAPFDMAAAPDGGVWILDRDNRRLWLLDRTFAVVRQNQDEIDLSAEPDIFTPVGKPPTVRPPATFPAGFSLDSGSPLQFIDPIAMAALPDGSVLLLESDPASDFSVLYRLRNGSQPGNPVSLSGVLSLLEPEEQANFRLLGYDFAFIPQEQTPIGLRKDTLYVVGQNGDQAWAFTVDYSTDQFTLTPIPEYYPMRLYGGRGLISGQTHVYYDSQSRWVPLIIQKRPRYVEEATLLTWVLDGKQPDCVWHKLMLDASIPPDTQVSIYSRAHNDPDFLQAQAWTEEPSPYLRGNGTEVLWTQLPSDIGTWELLFQRATGRYLQLKLTLSGNERLTPRLRALRAYYPRFSYLDHYLPGVYREDDQSASFLDRFLANFEGFYTSLEDRIATVQALLDANSAPSDALDWLANWFGVALDPSWTDAKRRLFLTYAALFFEARGTMPGLMMALRLALEDCADQGIFTSTADPRTGLRMVEEFRRRQLPPGLLQDAVMAPGLPIQNQTAGWTPALGVDELNLRYSNALQQPGTQYPIYLASTDPNYSQWTVFSMANLGLVPGQPDSVSGLWPTFLQGRYRLIGALNTVYRGNYTAFSDVPFPDSLPRLSQPLWDWYQFQGVLLIQASAHRFTLYLPMVPGDAQNVALHRSKLNLAQRVIELEKPAHTAYEIKFYWAFFRIGEARLGEDTVLDYGSRAPQLLQPALIGDTYLGSVYLARQSPERPYLKQGSC